MIVEILQFHFIIFPKRILQIWKNFLWFFANFFSIFDLLKTLFSPWRRIAFAYPKAPDIAKIVETFVGNMFSRFLGFVFRSCLILIGILFEIFVFLLGILILIAWFILPLFWIYLFFI